MTGETAGGETREPEFPLEFVDPPPLSREATDDREPEGSERANIPLPRAGGTNTAADARDVVAGGGMAAVRPASEVGRLV